MRRPPAQRRGDKLDCARDCGALSNDSRDGDRILRLHQRDGFFERHRVEHHRLRQPLFGEKLGAIGLHRGTVTDGIA